DFGCRDDAQLCIATGAELLELLLDGSRVANQHHAGICVLRDEIDRGSDGHGYAVIAAHAIDSKSDRHVCEEWIENRSLGCLPDRARQRPSIAVAAAGCRTVMSGARQQKSGNATAAFLSDRITNQPGENQHTYPTRLPDSSLVLRPDDLLATVVAV